MTIAACEEQILRIKRASFQPEMNEALEAELQRQANIAVQTTIEASLEAELMEGLAARTGDRPRRSGCFQRVLDTQYGRIPDLRVPNLRWGNKQREWRILQRYPRGLSSFLGLALYLYVLGLSLRDLQEACYFLLGAVISRSAINQITLQVQARIDEQRLAPISQPPAIRIVDGVWVEIQYRLDQWKEDRAGHQRQARQGQDRVILTALAVWPDGRYQVFHYEVAEGENDTTWKVLSLAGCRRPSAGPPPASTDTFKKPLATNGRGWKHREALPGPSVGGGPTDVHRWQDRGGLWVVGGRWPHRCPSVARHFRLTFQVVSSLSTSMCG
jgi:hypothetical protein